MIRILLLALLMGAAPAGAQTASDTEPSNQLAAQAKYWESRGRYDLARDSWLKLLRADPTNADALSGLALVEARGNSPASAQVYLDRLRETHPDHPQIRRIESAIRQGTYSQEQLAVPRGLAQQGRFEEAINEYQLLFGGTVPGGRLGLEFYQTLSGIDGKWDEARIGIESLAEEFPDEAVYQLALAQHYTYKEETRRRGIGMLASLADDPVVADSAQQGWRQALIWLNAKAGDERYYRSYLQRFGQDTEIAQRFQDVQMLSGGGSTGSSSSATPVDPRINALRRAYEVMNDGDVETAGALFRDFVEKWPEDAEGLAGLGIVRLRQQRFEEAEDLLARAVAREPKKAGKWTEALQSARFWGIVRRGEAARSRGEPEEAERLLRKALSVEPKGQQELSVRTTLADVLVQLDKIVAAEALYREILAREPRNINAIRGLFGIMAGKDRVDEAVALAEGLPEDLRLQIPGLPRLKARYYRDLAEIASENFDTARAEQLLKEALLLDPSSPWIRMDLARIYQQAGRIREANTLVDGILESNPNMSDALFIKALILAEQERWLEGLNLLERITLDGRNQGAVELQRRMWVRYQTERAAVLARFGRPNAAADILRAVEPNVAGQTELLGALATGWAEVGDEGRALRYMREALTTNPKPAPGLRLQYAALLFKLRQDAEFEVVMEDLVRRSDFSEQEALDLANLRVAYRLRQADQVREDGDLASAYEYLQPLLQVNANDPRTLMALARLYNDAKEFDRTLEIYQRVLNIDPKNLDAHKGAVGAALALNQLEQAASYLDQAFSIDNSNARLYALAGRLARQRGEDGRALQYFRKALELDAAQGNEEFGGDGRFVPQIELLSHEQAATDWRDMYRGGLLPRRAGAAVRDPLPQRLPYYADELPPADRDVPVWTGQTDDPASERYEVVPRYRQEPAPVYEYRQQEAPTVYEYRGEEAPTVYEYREPSRDDRYRGSSRGAPADQQEYGDTQYDSYPSSLQSTPSPARTPVIYAPGAYADEPAPTTSAALRFPGDFSLPPGAAAPGDGRLLKMSTAPRGSIPGDGEAVVLEQGPWIRSQDSGPAIVTEGFELPVAEAYPVEPLTGYRELPPERYYSVPYSEVTGASGTAGTEPAFSVEGPRAYPQTARQPIRIPLGPVTDQRRVLVEQREPVRRVQPVVVPRHFETQMRRESRFQREVRGEMQQIRRDSPPLRYAQDPVLERPSFLREAAPETAERRDLMRQIREIRAGRSARAGLGMSFRNREGQSGLSQLLDIELPAEISFAGTEAGRFSVRANPVFLSAGSVSGSELDFFGTLPLVDDPSLSFTQDASGVSLGLIYEVGDLRLDVGTSPLGFPVETIVGGMQWTPRTRDLRFRVDLSRRPVTDSLLSYAGTRDPGLGLDFGGVYRTGGRLDVAYDLGEYGAYVNGAYHLVDGLNTDDNRRLEVGGGFYARALERPGLSVTYGVNATSFFFDKNRRRFTFGHGGYFSPQFYLSLGVPVEVSGGRDRFSWKLNATLGVQAFREDAAPFFPTSSTLQTAYGEFLASNANTSSNTSPFYESNSVTGIGYNFAGEMEYLFAPQIAVGALLAVDNAQDFNESLILGYLRYWFTPQTSASVPPNTMLPYFNFGDPNR